MEPLKCFRDPGICRSHFETAGLCEYGKFLNWGKYSRNGKAGLCREEIFEYNTQDFVTKYT